MIVLLVIIVLVVLVALWGVTSYNRLIKLRNLVQEAWRQVDVELTRRHDLIPNLVETVKGYAAHERGTLEDVMAARSAAMSGGRTPADLAQSENVLTQTLGRLFAVAEAYPDLKANQNFLALQQELDLDRGPHRRRPPLLQRQRARAQHQGRVGPVQLIAGLAHIGRAEYFEAEGAQREAPQVSFGGPAGGPGQITGGAPAAPTTPPPGRRTPSVPRRRGPPPGR